MWGGGRNEGRRKWRWCRDRSEEEERNRCVCREQNVRAERENGEAGMDGTVRNVEMTTEMTGYMWVSVQNTWTEHHNNL